MVVTTRRAPAPKLNDCATRRVVIIESLLVRRCLCRLSILPVRALNDAVPLPPNGVLPILVLAKPFRRTASVFDNIAKPSGKLHRQTTPAAGRVSENVVIRCSFEVEFLRREHWPAHN